MHEANKTDGTIGKAVHVLEAVTDFERPVRLIELQAALPYPKGTLYRLLQTLVRQSLLAFEKDTQSYRPGVRLVRLAHSAWAHASLAPVARSDIRELSERLGETVHLAQMDSGQVLYIDKAHAKSPVKMYAEAGKIGPAYCTGVGKAMMAHIPPTEIENVLSQQSWHRFTEKTICNPETMRKELRHTQARGYAFDDEEHEPGIICIALPILGSNNTLLGALSVTSTSARNSLHILESWVPIIQRTVDSISQKAQDWSFPNR